MKASKTKILKNINKNLEQYYKITKNTVTSNKITLSEPSFSDKEAKVLLGNFLKCNISQGKNVKEFENAFAKKLVANMASQLIRDHQQIFWLLVH